LYERTAKAGDPQAMVNLALMYKTARGVEQDLEKTQLWLKTAADLGHKQAIEELKKIDK
jgi:TPR repeat protein